MHRLVRYISIWVVLVVVIGAWAGSGSWGENLQIIRNEQIGEAHVTVLCDHGIVDYGFWVGDSRFEGSGSPGPPNPSIGELRVGEKLVVYYDRRDPHRSRISYPEADSELDGLDAWLVLFTSTIIVLFMSGEGRKMLRRMSTGGRNHRISRSLPRWRWSGHDSFSLRLRLTPEQAMLRIAGTAGGEDHRHPDAIQSTCFRFERAGNQFSVHRDRIGRQGLHRALFARIDACESGCEIKGSFDVNRWTRMVLTIWFLLVIPVGIVLAVRILPQFHEHELPLLRIPVGMLLFGLVLTAVSKYLYRRDRDEISGWLRHLFVDAVATPSKPLAGKR